MRAAVIPSSKITTKTLRAKDYVPSLPGLATHYAPNGSVACGTYAPPSRQTADTKKANCKLCMRTKAFRSS
jgi:hypothetical protein